MAKQATMVYRAPVEGARLTHNTALGVVEYQILEMDDDEPAPDGWLKNYMDVFATPEAPKRGRKPKVADTDTEADGDSN